MNHSGGKHMVVVIVSADYVFLLCVSREVKMCIE